MDNPLIKKPVKPWFHGLLIALVICVLGSAVIHAAETRLKTGINKHPSTVFPGATGAPQGQRERLALTPEQRTWLTAHSTIRVAFDGYPHTVI